MWNHPNSVLITVAHGTYQRKDSQLLKSHSKALFCAAHCLPSVEVFPSHSFLQICLLPMRQVTVTDMLSDSAGSAAVFSEN